MGLERRTAVCVLDGPVAGVCSGRSAPGEVGASRGRGQRLQGGSVVAKRMAVTGDFEETIAGLREITAGLEERVAEHRELLADLDELNASAAALLAEVWEAVRLVQGIEASL